jgi:hypothetical protein
MALFDPLDDQQIIFMKAEQVQRLFTFCKGHDLSDCLENIRTDLAMPSLSRPYT